MANDRSLPRTRRARVRATRARVYGASACGAVALVLTHAAGAHAVSNVSLTRSAKTSAAPAYLRFINIGRAGEFADLVLDRVPLVRGIASDEASPFVAVPSGWHHIETNVPGSSDSLEIAFGTLQPGRSYDLIRSTSGEAASLVEEPSSGGPLRIVDLRRAESNPVNLKGAGADVSLSPGDIIARAPARGASVSLAVTDRTGYRLAETTLTANGTDHQDLVAIVQTEHGTEILSFPTTAPIQMAPQIAAPQPASSVSFGMLGAAAAIAVGLGGLAGRARVRRRRGVAARESASQDAFRLAFRS
jgi:hypothetical protein